MDFYHRNECAHKDYLDRVLFESKLETTKGALIDAVKSGANLKWADLRGAYLEGADLEIPAISDGELFVNGETASTSNSFITRTTSKEFDERISKMANELAKDLGEKAVEELINNDKTKENERD